MKKLTIGITTYNNDPFIYNLIYEIESQVKLEPKILDYIEFILYDDCSSSSEFLNSVPAYMEVIKSGINSGTPATGRNIIINKARGKYLFFVDGDDLIIRNLMELLIELDEKDEDILFSEVVKLGADGQYIKSPFIYTYALFEENLAEATRNKICVHQTGIWSIYKVSFLRKNNIKYTSEIRYEDNLFLYTILVHEPVTGTMSEPHYGWRTNVQSFSYSIESIKQRKLIYRKTMELLVDNLESDFAPYILFSIWNQTYSNIIRNYPNLNTQETKVFFDKLEIVTKEYSSEISYLKSKVDQQYVDRYFLASEKFWFKGFSRILGLKQINRLRQNKGRLKKEVLKAFRLLPIQQDKVFMMSQYGKFTSNPKYLYKQIKDDSEKNIVYFVKDDKLHKHKHFRDYNNKIQFYYHFYTAQKVYFDSWLDPELLKRSNQTWVQMWHGYPYKKMYTDIEIYAHVNSIEKHTKKSSNIRNWDQVYSLDKNNTEIFENLFPGVEVIESEYPRITWMKKNTNDEKLKASIRKKYNLNADKKYTLFAPTYRPYKVYFDDKEIMSLCNPNNELLYHPHPMLNTNLDLGDQTMKNVEIQELLLVVDEIITDYSSIKYDYLQINDSSKVIDYKPDEKLYKQLHGLYSVEA